MLLKKEMNKIFINIIVLLLLGNLASAQHPCLTLTKQGVDKIKQGLGNTPIFDRQYELVKKEIDQQILAGFDVPIPKDMAGGYTHEKHKYNYKLMHKAGNLYQISGEEKYADFVKDMLMEYAKMYPTLPVHPTKRSYATGKIFWQCLNDANWLVFTSQAYDCIYDYLTKEERMHLENDLFIPFANFLSDENPRFFNRIHNHSTWANAAVGMMALAMENDTLLEKALYGLKNDGINPDEVDNDGGYIKKDGIRQAGFLAQLDYSFSPEGYFTEGPYYQRYAIFPFLVFSHAIHNNRPDIKIFEYRDEILVKATKALLELTDPQGNFFPINDAQKGMNYTTYELVTAVDLMYLIRSEEKSLLNWAAKQGSVSFNEAGFYVAQSLNEMTLDEPIKRPIIFGDGVDGTAGAISVMRMSGTELLFKFASHGMGHGHFDRLSYSLYDESGEIAQDYGAVRWVNVDQKAGGRYLPENKTFGKQTIGHNTAVVNHKSQFNGKIKNAEEVNPTLYHSDFSDSGIQFVSAVENNAYKGVDMQRVLMMIEDPSFVNPIIVDLFTLSGEENIEVDLPFWYTGHLMRTSFECKKSLDGIKPLGDGHGYQHIWEEASCMLEDKHFQFNWFGNQRFYTLSAASEAGDEILMGRAGANDPNFNLRSDPVLIHRKKENKRATYFNIIESHGHYSTVTEIPIKPYSDIDGLEILYSDDDYIVCSFIAKDQEYKIYCSLRDNKLDSKHTVTTENAEYTWTGVYKLVTTKK